MKPEAFAWKDKLADKFQLQDEVLELLSEKPETLLKKKKAFPSFFDVSFPETTRVNFRQLTVPVNRTFAFQNCIV